jgi:hypothetical protein
MNIERLISKIDEINIPISTITEKLGMSRQAFYNRISGKCEFKVSEVEKVCEILRLTSEEKSTIFFDDKVDKTDN